MSKKDKKTQERKEKSPEDLAVRRASREKKGRKGPSCGGPVTGGKTGDPDKDGCEHDKHK